MGQTSDIKNCKVNSMSEYSHKTLWEYESFMITF